MIYVIAKYPADAMFAPIVPAQRALEHPAYALAMIIHPHVGISEERFLANRSSMPSAFPVQWQKLVGRRELPL